MSQAACVFCSRILPLGGVLDDVGRPCHYYCRAVKKLEIAEHARVTVQRVATMGKPSRAARPSPTLSYQEEGAATP